MRNMLDKSKFWARAHTFHRITQQNWNVGVLLGLNFIEYLWMDLLSEHGKLFTVKENGITIKKSNDNLFNGIFHPVNQEACVLWTIFFTWSISPPTRYAMTASLIRRSFHMSLSKNPFTNYCRIQPRFARKNQNQPAANLNRPRR